MSDVQTLSGIDRRPAVRAGVATAWSVPLVQATVLMKQNQFCYGELWDVCGPGGGRLFS